MNKNKKPQGRPPVPLEEQQKRRNITISNSTWEKAKSIGNGNFSAGIRIAIEEFSSINSNKEYY